MHSLPVALLARALGDDRRDLGAHQAIGAREGTREARTLSQRTGIGVALSAQTNQPPAVDRKGRSFLALARKGNDMVAPAEAPRRFVQIPTDYERTSAGGYDLAYRTCKGVGLPRGALDRAGQAELLGVVSALFHRYTQQATISVDAILRTASGGVRRIALDVEVTADSPLSEAIAQAAAALGATHLGPENRDHAPSNIAVTFVEAPPGWTGSIDVAAFTDTASTDYDLHFVLLPARDLEPVVVAYNAKLFAASSVDRLIGAFVALFRAASRDQKVAVARLAMLGPAEIRALTVEQDSGTVTSPATPVHRLFEALAKKQPEALAARFGDRSLSYAELEERSNRLAQHLVASAVGAGVAVGVCVRPSLDVLVAILAIFKARGLYLPLDPTHPEALIARMLEEAQPRLVLTHSSLSGLTRPDQFSQLCLDTDWGLVEAHPATAPATAPSLDDPAYLLYTSGTTGRPKGVLATQANLAHYIQVAQQRYGFCATDVFSSLARYTFSISLFDLLSPLCCGGSVRIVDRDQVLAPERLCRVLQEVTVVHAGPSLLGSLFRYLRSTPSAPRTFPRMRHASTGGDLVPPSIVEEMKRVFENAENYVIYGCTEISCMGTTFPVSRDAKVTRSFVGKPFADVAMRVLDPRRELVPFGVVGEICFAGEGIVRGYLHQPELTAQKFVELEGRRFYPTGDMGRLHADGNLEFLGRKDFQVQLRGIRVELAAIENTVRELGLAAQCAVVARQVDADDVRLVAFVVKPSDANVIAFRRALSAQLPDYMLPQHVVVLDAMPLTANGKLDRNRLQQLPWETDRGATKRAPPQSHVEQRIAEVFCSVLGVRDVGVDENFFDLGGHSLLAVVAMQEIERALGATLSPYVLFECATVRALAAHVHGPGQSESRPILLNERCVGSRLFMLSGIHIYHALAKRLEGRCSVYGVFARSELGTPDSATAPRSVGALAREYVDMIRREQATGPYRLLGYSFAGLVAYEVAQQLRDAGEEVRFLALVDAVLPEWNLGWRFRLSQLARLSSVPPRHLLAFVTRRVMRAWEAPGSDEFARFADDPKAGPLERQRDAVNYRAAAEYLTALRPFNGNVALIASGERLRKDPLKSPSGGWSPHVASLHVETIDGDHFQILDKEPFVSQLAEILVARMQVAEHGANGVSRQRRGMARGGVG